jgi:hypothetical protein
MPKNLLAWQGRLATQECETIAYAMRNYGPKDNLLTDYASYRIAATACGASFFLLDRKGVIAALLKAGQRGCPGLSSWCPFLLEPSLP